MNYTVEEYGKVEEDWRAILRSSDHKWTAFSCPEALDQKVAELRSQGHGVRWILPDISSYELRQKKRGCSDSPL